MDSGPAPAAHRGMTNSVRILRRALLQIRPHRLGLVRTADQLLLLDGLREQRRAGIDREIVEQALRGADRIGALAGDLACDLKSRSARIIADAGRETVRQRLLRREDAPGV